MAYFRGAPWWIVVPAAGLYGAMLLAGALPRILLAASAAVLLSSATPLGLSMSGLGTAAALALLTILPLALELGGTAPSARGAWVLASAGALTAAFFLTPPGVVVRSSDLAKGTFVVILAASLLATTSIAAWRER